MTPAEQRSRRREAAHGVRFATAFTALLALALVAGADAAEERVNAVKPKVYLGRQIAYTMTADGADWLIRQEREQEESTQQMIAALELEEGMVVADVGCGNGYHALMMARRVGPAGKVYCVDIQQRMLDLLAVRAKRAGITNCALILGSSTSPQLPAGKIDLVLLVDAYHEFTDPESMLRNMRRSLAPDGVIVLAEYRAEDPTVPMKPDHKMSKQQIEKEMQANGFRLRRSYDELPWQHLVFYEKAPADR
jgi:ubiquinone/menaquinone biosynthesis C-methylase UbiE